MDVYSYPYYSGHNKTISNNYQHEYQNPNYNFNTFNIASIDNESNAFDYESNNPHQNPKKNQEYNNEINFSQSPINSKENNPNQNELNYADSVNNLKKEEENEIIDNNLQNISLKENENEIENENEKSDNINQTNSIGRWTKEEHEKFIEGILKFGNEWKKVQKIIKTRSSTQARSHAQKYFLRIKKEINSDILSNPDKLIDYIINSTYDSKKNLALSFDQKEKLMTVIKSNLKAEENLSRSGKEGNSGIIFNSNNLNEKEESGMDDIAEEEDNLAYNKEKDMFEFKTKKSLEMSDKKRKPTFCSKKRKSSGDLSHISKYNKIFNITKETSHKASLDITKSNNIIVNNIANKNSAQINSNNKIIKFNIRTNNNNYIPNKSNNTSNNFQKKKKINNKTNNNFYIQNNVINIFTSYNNNINNNINNDNINNININSNLKQCEYIPKELNNQFSKKYSNINNDLKHSVPKNIFNTIQINPSANEFSENKNKKYIINNQNFFPNFNVIENPEKPNENEQCNPFNINFEKIISNDMKIKEGYCNQYLEGIFDAGGHSLSDFTNNNLYNDN